MFDKERAASAPGLRNVSLRLLREARTTRASPTEQLTFVE